MKSSLEGLNINAEQKQKKMCYPEDMSIEIIQPETERSKINNEQRPMDTITVPRQA